MNRPACKIRSGKASCRVGGQSLAEQRGTLIDQDGIVMTFVGNRRGPRNSAIVANHGAMSFGITPEALEIEVVSYEADEAEGQVAP